MHKKFAAVLYLYFNIVQYILILYPTNVGYPTNYYTNIGQLSSSLAENSIQPEKRSTAKISLGQRRSLGGLTHGL